MESTWSWFSPKYQADFLKSFIWCFVCCFTLFNLQGTRRFPAGFYFTSSSFVCQVLFRFHRSFFQPLKLRTQRPQLSFEALRLSATAYLLYQLVAHLSSTFFRSFRGFQTPPLCFLYFSEAFHRPPLSRRPDYCITLSLVCQVLFSALLNLSSGSSCPHLTSRLALS